MHRAYTRSIFYLLFPYFMFLNSFYYLQNIIERFPVSLIKEPTAFTSNGPTELYNNILVFIVNGGNGSRSEMHIFQVSLYFVHAFAFFLLCSSAVQYSVS